MGKNLNNYNVFKWNDIIAYNWNFSFKFLAGLTYFNGLIGFGMLYVILNIETLIKRNSENNFFKMRKFNIKCIFKTS